ncbi:hypothetical protein [Streptomyces sp. NPDC060027]|uniref:hypothetical protein n=1 Tax=Streptomyces sp. NPDC060027 TaxID=3347040 RepID=UPI0036B33777
MAEQDPNNQAGHTVLPHAPQSAGSEPTTWQPALEMDRVRSAAAGLGVLRLARREPGGAGESLRGIALAVGSAAGLAVTGLILSQFEDAGWVQIFRGLLIALIAGVLIGLIRAVRGLVRARMAVYVYDHGVVGTARRSIRTIRWDQVTQIVVFSTEGVHIAAEERPMIIPAAVVGGGAADRAEFLNAVVPPLEQRGVEVLRF